MQQLTYVRALFMIPIQASGDEVPKLGRPPLWNVGHVDVDNALEQLVELLSLELTERRLARG